MGRTFEERFWAKVDKRGLDDCWPWTAAQVRLGYGRIRGQVDNRLIGAHRASYEMAYGPIPAGYDVCHTCDNPPCVNPAHLVVGTAKFNMADAKRKGRMRNGISVGSANGSAKLTEAQIAEIRRSYAAGEMSQIALGTKFGVSHTAIGYALRAKTWRNVAEERIYPATTTYRTTCKRGHPLRQTRLRRVCDECGRERHRRYEARRHGATVNGTNSTPALNPSEDTSTSL